VAWASNTEHIPGGKKPYVILQDDDNLVMYDEEVAGSPWSSKSARPLLYNTNPTEGHASPATPFSAKIMQILNLLKFAVTQGLALVPKVGGLLSALADVLWPDREVPQLTWEVIEKGVKELTQGLIDENNAVHLRQST